MLEIAMGFVYTVHMLWKMYAKDMRYEEVMCVEAG